MAATRFIEVERGTFAGFAHSHNGYYAGDFSRSRATGGSRAITVPATAVPGKMRLERPELAQGLRDRPAVP